jgi:heme/copper-type cytochrome/quinol oxidase subunit 2
MYGHDNGDWLWMTLVMGFWVIVLGVVVYAAVRFAQRGRGGGSDQ